MTDRIASTFDRIKQTRIGGFVAFITAGDPDYETSIAIMKGLPDAGVDIIELGMPFSDPMADGASIQAANLRALAAGQDMHKTLQMVKDFRKDNDTTPIVLMGYYNPIYNYGNDAFLADAKSAGVDGLIIVDLPPEEDGELCVPAKQADLHFIRLLTPTSDDERLQKLSENVSGFVYYVSVRGITGTQKADISQVSSAVSRINKVIDLPVVVGFGLRDNQMVKDVAKTASAAVVGSAIVDKIAENLGEKPQIITKKVLDYVKSLTAGLTKGRRIGR